MTVPTGALVTFASDTPLRLGSLASIWSHAHGPVPPPEHAYLDAADELESVGDGTVGSNASASATGTATGTVAGTVADGEASEASLTPLPPPPTAQEISSRYPALDGGANGGWHVVCRYRLRILPLLEGAGGADGADGTHGADDAQAGVTPPTTVPTRFQLHLPSLESRPYFRIVTTETDHTTYVCVGMRSTWGCRAALYRFTLT